jgi:hypothetical protein
MQSFKLFNSRLSSIFGLPTLRGLILFGILGTALWLSITENSETERWIFLFMIFLLLIHLMETSKPFQMATLKILPFDPPFAAEAAPIPVQITNSIAAPLDGLSLRFEKTPHWTQIPALLGNSSVVIFLPYTFTQSGKQQFPRLTVRNIPRPAFFRFWRIERFQQTTLVLPTPVDHQIQATTPIQLHEESEQTEFEQILDPRLFSLRDQKLYLKTGRSYLRVYQAPMATKRAQLSWFTLIKLNPLAQGEQFSFWIRVFSQPDNKNTCEVSINTPFLNQTNLKEPIDWTHVKNLFAQWFYAQP